MGHTTKKSSKPSSTSLQPAGDRVVGVIDGKTVDGLIGEKIPNSGMKTEDASGVLHIQPFRSSTSKGMKALISFTPRTSRFDLSNPQSQRDEFRGFFTLFWVLLFLFFLRTAISSYRSTGQVLSSTFASLITKDGWVLAMSDAVLVATTILSVPFVKAIHKGWIKYSWTGICIQHIFQAVYLGIAVRWTFHREWYWVQSGFLVLHTMTMMMKMHSYIAHNGMLSEVATGLKRTEAHLADVLAKHPGGEEQALLEAKSQLDELAESSSLPGTPDLTGLGSTSSAQRELKSEMSTSLLKQRLNASLASANGSDSISVASSDSPSSTASLNITRGTSLEPSHLHDESPALPSHPLSAHPSKVISTLAKNITAMKAELRSNGKKGIDFPKNVTYINFLDYLLVPTLVYELEYPRTERIRITYVLEKIIATFGTFSLIYTITEHYINPQLPKLGDSLFVSFVNLAIPMMVNYLLIFYIIFECICNGFAELSMFADREFYSTWWNSTSWDQFARDWNKPVHTFLLRHVYSSSLSSGKVNKTSAAFLTFFLSALCHELVMFAASKKVRPYLFALQMAQLPMIALGKMTAIQKQPVLGNSIFWLGLLAGFPLLCIAYLVY